MSVKRVAGLAMTEEARALTRELLRHHEQVCESFGVDAAENVTDRMIDQSIIPYGVFCERAGVPFLTRGVGQFLQETAEFCDQNDWPPLNALAVNVETGMPGDGYDIAPGCALIRWPEDVKRCIAFGGYPPSTEI